MNALLLDLRNIQKSYPSDAGSHRVLDGVSASVSARETLALTGESGSGKSTLLHLAGGLDQPDGGEVLLEGQNIGMLDDAARAMVRRLRIGLIFQQFNLVPP